MAHVILNVCGMKYEVLVATLLNCPETMLGSLVEKWNTSGEFSADAPTREVFIDRNGERFQYILDWYRDGRIVLPPHVPREAMLGDVEFFGLPSNAVAPARQQVAVLSLLNKQCYIEGATVPGTDTLHRSIWGCPVVDNNHTAYPHLTALAADGWALSSTQRVPHPDSRIKEEIFQYIFTKSGY
eukprot:TRINITY_DN26001_c1_g2_i2.p1 TRINITY_DN26001_c1_g2~~TRINITY_DN26001_c1_g2_i2.p1  ORF type:complete len:184 (+),score=74.48 TRINITY_DN26001_c1_g2_i2:70-621(+)